jgi:hypothetical protein
MLPVLKHGDHNQKDHNPHEGGGSMTSKPVKSPRKDGKLEEGRKKGKDIRDLTPSQRAKYVQLAQTVSPTSPEFKVRLKEILAGD